LSTSSGLPTTIYANNTRHSPRRSVPDSQALEAYGIFSIGEIIGRRNLVGYSLTE
jgi:hypothetical protein